MTRHRGRSLARVGAAASASIVLAAAVALTADYATARARLPGETARIEVLQAEARDDSAAARALGAEHDRITRARLARNARIEALAWVLIAGGAGFLGAAKWQIAQGPRRPPAPSALLHVRRLPILPAAREPLLVADAGADSAPPPPMTLDLTFVDRLVAAHGTDRDVAITLLQAIQAHYRYLPDEALRRVCELTEVTPAQVAGTSSFYARFRRSPAGEHTVRVCHGTACHVSGARQITDELRRRLRIPDGADTDPHGLFTIDEVACIGCCSLAPVIMVDEHTTGNLTPDTAVAALDAAARADSVGAS